MTAIILEMCNNLSAFIFFNEILLYNLLSICIYFTNESFLIKLLYLSILEPFVNLYCVAKIQTEGFLMAIPQTLEEIEFSL